MIENLNVFSQHNATATASSGTENMSFLAAFKHITAPILLETWVQIFLVYHLH